jgi:hypothetical protein
MRDTHSIGGKLWLTAAWLAAGLVLVVALGSAGLGVVEHVKHEDAQRKADALEKDMAQGSAAREYMHAIGATSDVTRLQELGFSSWEMRDSDEQTLSAMRASAERRRDERDAFAIAAPLILLFGLGLVVGVYRWGLWIVR